MVRNVFKALTCIAFVSLASLVGCVDVDDNPEFDDTSDSVTSGTVDDDPEFDDTSDSVTSGAVDDDPEFDDTSDSVTSGAVDDNPEFGETADAVTSGAVEVNSACDEAADAVTSGAVDDNPEFGETADSVTSGAVDDNPEFGEMADSKTGVVRIRFTQDQKQNWIHYGFDIKQKERTRKKWLNKERAGEIFGKSKFDLIRIPIYALRAHHHCGEVDGDKYKYIVRAVRLAKKAGHDVKVFASLYLEEKKVQKKEPSFPNWVMRGDHVDPDHYARLLKDFLKFMRRKGITVDYLGPDNEPGNSHSKMTPARFIRVVQALKELCDRDRKKPRIALPQIIGNDAARPRPGAEWLGVMRAQPKRYLLDVAGVHYHSKSRMPGSLANWAKSAKSAGKRHLWDTEFHWNRKKRGDKVDEFNDAKRGLMAAFDNFDEGLENITWWAYNPQSVGGLTANLQSALVDATIHSRLLVTHDQDGVALGEDKFNSRAFRQKSKTNDKHVDVTLIGRK